MILVKFAGSLNPFLSYQIQHQAYLEIQNKSIIQVKLLCNFLHYKRKDNMEIIITYTQKDELHDKFVFAKNKGLTSVSSYVQTLFGECGHYMLLEGT